MKKLKRKKNPTSSRAINRYKGVNLNIGDIHYDFTNTLFRHLNIYLSENDISLQLLKKNTFEVKTPNEWLITPPIDSFQIIVEDVMIIKLHALMDGICLFDLNVIESERGNGLGKFAMQTMCAISEFLNMPIYLIPVDYEGCMGIETLRNFYHSFDFKRRKKSSYWEYYPNQIRIAC